MIKHARTVWALLTAAALAATTLSCGREEAGAPTMEFALSGNPDTLDPHRTTGTLTFQTTRSFYDTLVEPDRSGDLVPALAESWDISEDGLTWTFSLRDGVRFHNGEPLTSSDVRATFERLTDPATASPSAGEFAAITEIETPDEATVILRLSEPTAPLLASIASGWGAILPASLVEQDHDFGNEPVGTGPFRFVEWVPDSRIVMERNDDYWMEGHPRIGGVVINIIPESAVQLQGLLTGELHAVDMVNQQDLETLREDDDVYVQTDLSALVMVLAMNNERAPMNDVRFRQAVAHAIAKQSTMDIAYGGGEVVGTFMDVSDPYYVDLTDVYPYDPARSREILAEIGGSPTEPLVMSLPENYQPHVRAGEMYEAMLEEVGIPVELRLVDWSTWLNEVYRGSNYDMTVIGHTGKLDPDGRLRRYGTGETYVHWDNAEAAALIDEARRTVDPGRRRDLYSLVLEMMAREVPHVYVGTSYRYLAMRRTVSGLHQDAKLDTFDFRYVEIDE
ncbi:MAG: ABC transporter substrate-binding protein [Spirochaetota bacterium]